MKIYFILLTVMFYFPVNMFPYDFRDSTDIIKFSRRIPYDLKISVTVKETMPIGYAYCFNGKVIDVQKGKLKDNEVLITILAGDDSYYNLLSKAAEDDIFEFYLVFNKSDEPYSTAYVTGFVDSDKNSWRITGVNRK